MSEFNAWEFQPISGRARWASRLMIAALTMTIIVALIDAAGTLAFETWNDMAAPVVSDGELALASLLALAGLGTIVVWILNAVFFFRWLYRASSNARALKGERLQYSPGWSVGWWFVPFANLIMPHRVVREIYETSHAAAEGPDQLSHWLAPLLNTWWGAWLVFNIASQVSGRLGRMDNDPALVEAGVWVGLAAAPIGIFALVKALRIVHGITEAQEQAARQRPELGFNACRSCGYDLRASAPSTPCPEGGALQPVHAGAMA